MRVYLNENIDHTKTTKENLAGKAPLFETNEHVPDRFEFQGDCYTFAVRKGDEYMLVDNFKLKQPHDDCKVWTDEITCPYCTSTIGDSWEMEDEGEYDCDSCGGTFKYEREVEVTYTSKKVKGPEITVIKESTTHGETN